MAYINGKKVLQSVINAGGSESSTLIPTATDATLVSGSTYELALTYLTETPKVNDFIVYVDSGALTTLYKVTAVDSTNATLTKIGDIGGGGSQSYQHNITCGYAGTNTYQYFTFSITNNSATKILTRDAIGSALNSKGFTSVYKLNNCSGTFGVSASQHYVCVGIYYDISATTPVAKLYGKVVGSTNEYKATLRETFDNIEDVVIPL